MKHSAVANAIKVVSVAVGLLTAILLLSQIAYNHSFDTCFKDCDNLYRLHLSVSSDYSNYNINSAPYPFAKVLRENAKDDISKVIAYNNFSTIFQVIDKNRVITDKVLLVDSAFISDMGLKVIKGTPTSDFMRNDIIYVSDETARMTWGDEEPIGRTLTYDDRLFTVAGVFESLPGNTTMPFDVMIPISLYRDNTEWANYSAFLLRLNDTSPEGVERAERTINNELQRNMPDRESYKRRITIEPLRQDYISLPSVRRANTIMWVMSMSLLLITITNYILITLSSMARRSKSIGIHKCSGAEGVDIFRMFVTETVIILAAALLLMVVMTFLFRDFITDTLSTPVSALLAPSRLWVAASVFAVFFIFGAFIPARIMSRMPVTMIFRRYTEKRSLWKPVLLFVQFGSVALVAGLLCISSAQYMMLMNREPGYNPENVVYAHNPDPDYYKSYDNLNVIKKTLGSLPFVADIAGGGASPADDTFNTRFIEQDNIKFETMQDYVDDNFNMLMEIKPVYGDYFKNKYEVLVNEEFCRLMKWHDSEAKGKTIEMNGENYTVAGVVTDINLGGFYATLQPMAWTYAERPPNNIYIKLKEPFGKNLLQLNEFAKMQYPGTGIEFQSLESKIYHLYRPARTFRNSVLASTVAILFIAFMGLVGYVRDDIQRRTKEIAIRKVNGASSRDIIRMFALRIVTISIPAVTLGIAVAWLTGRIWLQQFAVHADHLPLLMIGCALLIILVIVVATIAMTRQVAYDNPVNSIKSE